MSQFTYEEITSPMGDKIILRSDGAQIPCNPANSDYQAYLEEQANDQSL
jgi:hypothetical protein